MRGAGSRGARARSFDSQVRRFASVGSPAVHARRRARSIAIVRLALMLNTPSGLFAPLGPNESDVASGSSPPAARGSERILRARRRRHVRRTRRSLRVNDPTHTHCARPNDRSHAARTGRRRARTRDRTGTTAPKKTKQKIAPVAVLAEADAHRALALSADELRVDAAHRLAGAGRVVLEEPRERHLPDRTEERDPRSDRDAGQTDDGRCLSEIHSARRLRMSERRPEEAKKTRARLWIGCAP